MRKGYIHTLEAVLSMLLVFTYYAYLITSVEPSSSDESAEILFEELLSSLERHGDLQTYGIDKNETGFKERVRGLAPARFKAEVKIQTMNTTSWRITPTQTPATRNFTINLTGGWTMESARMFLWLGNIPNPKIEINEDEAYATEGNLTEVDISGYVTDGENKINITADGGPELRYEIEIQKSKSTGTVPTNQSVRASSYLVSGSTSEFQPTELKIYYWM